MQSTADGLNGGYTTTPQNLGSTLTTGGSLTTVSGHDTTLVDAMVKAGGNVTMPDVNNLLTNEADVMNAANEGAGGGEGYLFAGYVAAISSSRCDSFVSHSRRSLS